MSAPGGRVIAHGIDLVVVARVARSIEEHGEAFLSRVYTGAERAYCDGRARRLEHLAARFAAKEAVLKALGTGWGRGVAWTDVEVVSGDDGRPSIALHARAAAIARDLGIASWSVSITHTSEHAMASALALGE